MAKKPRADQLAPRGEGKANKDVQYWLDEISASRKRDEEFRKTGDEVREIYGGERKDSTPFNILFSNTEIIAPAIYSQVPRPVVRRRYKDDDPIGLAAAKAGQRILEFLLDTNIEGYDTANECLKAVALDGLLPGRGNSSLKYDADVQDVYTGKKDDAGKPISSPKKKSELVCPEIRSWDRTFYGYAKKWSKVPWIAYEEHIDRAEAKALFGDLAKQLKFTKGEESDFETGKRGRKSDDERNTGARKTALIYQIWDREGGRKVRYISPDYKDGFLLVDDDQLNITGFFNCPRPIQFIEKTDDMVPVAPYLLYQNQAEELNTLTIRISKITKAIKARGGYDGELGDDLARIFDEDDNGLIALDKASSLAAEKGLENAIWMIPVDKLIQTLKELVAAREMCKQVIYEIMGISDIVRGASKASETLGAQQIKSQWGTLRIKPKQAEVQRYACDMLRIMLEIAAQKFSEETWARMTGLPYLTSAQISQGKTMLAAAQTQALQAQSALTKLTGGMAPPSPQDQAAAAAAQATAAKPVLAQTPRQQQAIAANQQSLQQAQATIQKLQQIEQTTPKWPEVLASLKDDIQRSYKIDIETNSTIEPEAAEDQKNIADMMAALGQFLQAVGPLVQQGMMPFQVAQSMLLAITRRFRFGDEIEEMIQQMQPPPGDDKSKQALDAANQQIQQLQGQLQQKEAEARARELESKQKDMDHEAEKGKLNDQLSQAATDQNSLLKEKELDKREAQLRNEQKALENDRKVFKLEQDRAAEKIAHNAEKATQKIKGDKDLATETAKRADKTHKDAIKVGEDVDKTAKKHLETIEQAAGKVKDMLTDTIQKVSMLNRGEVGGPEIADLVKQNAETTKVLKDLIAQLGKPKKTRSKIERGADGRATHLVQESD